MAENTFEEKQEPRVITPEEKIATKETARKVWIEGQRILGLRTVSERRPSDSNNPKIIIANDKSDFAKHQRGADLVIELDHYEHDDEGNPKSFPKKVDFYLFHLDGSVIAENHQNFPDRFEGEERIVTKPKVERHEVVSKELEDLLKTIKRSREFEEAKVIQPN